MYEIVNNVKCSILCVNNILYQSDDFALLNIKMGLGITTLVIKFLKTEEIPFKIYQKIKQHIFGK